MFHFSNSSEFTSNFCPTPDHPCNISSYQHPTTRQTSVPIIVIILARLIIATMNLFRLLALQAVIFGKHTSSTATQAQRNQNQSRDYIQFQQDQSEELAQHLIKSAIQRTEVFSKGVEVLNKLESSPSCSRLALHGLISECESLQRSSSTETALEEIKEQYAARLAICEVSGAGVTPPKDCQAFISFEGTPDSSRSHQSCSSPTCFERLRPNQVKSCLAALVKENQLWTSFSNSLQNVVYVCQASRTWVEKGKNVASRSCYTSPIRGGGGVRSFTTQLNSTISLLYPNSVQTNSSIFYAKACGCRKISHPKSKLTGLKRTHSPIP